MWMIILLKGQLKRKLSTSKADGPAAKQHSIEKTGQYLYVINWGRQGCDKSLSIQTNSRHNGFQFGKLGSKPLVIVGLSINNSEAGDLKLFH